MVGSCVEGCRKAGRWGGLDELSRGVRSLGASEDVHAEKPGKHGEDAGQQGEAEEAGGWIMLRCFGHVAPPSRLMSRSSGYRCSTMAPLIVFQPPAASPVNSWSDAAGVKVSAYECRYAG
jgi:hypothetical protein